jgi:hypothetical protein
MTSQSLLLLLCALVFIDVSFQQGQQQQQQQQQQGQQIARAPPRAAGPVPGKQTSEQVLHRERQQRLLAEIERNRKKGVCCIVQLVSGCFLFSNFSFFFFFFFFRNLLHSVAHAKVKRRQFQRANLPKRCATLFVNVFLNLRPPRVPTKS